MSQETLLADEFTDLQTQKIMNLQSHKPKAHELINPKAHELKRKTNKRGRLS